MSSAPDVSIVSSGHDISDARLHRHVAALRGAGLTVEVAALGDPADAPDDLAAVRTEPRGSMAARWMRARRVVREARGRVVVTLDPDVLVNAARARRDGTVRSLIADVHEDYAALLTDRRWARGPAGMIGARIAARAVEACADADVVSVADDHLLPEAPRRVVVKNVPVVGDRPELDPRPRAVYVGDLRASRGLFAMLDALAAAPDWTLDLVGPIAPSDQDQATARIAALDGRVRWHDRLPPRASWEIAAGAWVGLALLDDTPAFRAATPSKLYEYAAHGMVTVASDLPGHRAFVGAVGEGRVVADAAAAGAVMRELAADPAGVERACAASYAFARTSSVYDEGSPRLAAAIAALLDGARP